jgi:hypothetical protein
MSTEVETPQEEGSPDTPVSAAEVASSANGSLLGRIKAARDIRVANESLTLPIPTWGGDLVARYRVVDRSQLEELAKRARQGKNTDSGADINFLARACEGVLMRDPDTGAIEPVLNGHGVQVRFDHDLAALLGVEAESATDVVLYLFKSNAVAIASHAMKIATWMQDTSQEIDEAILGESEPAAPLS